MFAVIEEGAKQYLVHIGDIIKVEKIDAEVGSAINFSKVVLTSSGLVSSADVKVTAEVLEHKKNKKVIVFKKKRRHNYRRKNGHRQNITVVKVTAIQA